MIILDDIERLNLWLHDEFRDFIDRAWEMQELRKLEEREILHHFYFRKEWEWLDRAVVMSHVIRRCENTIKEDPLYDA